MKVSEVSSQEAAQIVNSSRTRYGQEAKLKQRLPELVLADGRSSSDPVEMVAWLADELEWRGFRPQKVSEIRDHAVVPTMEGDYTLIEHRRDRYAVFSGPSGLRNLRPDLELFQIT